MASLSIFEGDNLSYLYVAPNSFVDLIYIDPPFNTGKVQRLAPKRGGKTVGQERSYNDSFTESEYMDFLANRLTEAYRVLKPTGSLFFHIDYREVHYCKVLLDKIFGRDSFINELVWAYDYGARSKRKWSCKHDNILWYAKDPKHYTFNYEAIDRIPYMAPGLVGPEKAARGKTPTDVWWNTIVPTNSPTRTGYPSQKPRKIIDRIVKVHSNEGDLCMDFFAGSGTFGESCMVHNRNCILIDQNPQAIEVMKRRLERYNPEVSPCPDLPVA